MSGTDFGILERLLQPENGCNAPALVQGGKTYTYSECLDAIVVAKNRYLAAGYTRGYRVALCLPTGAEFVLEVLAAIATGLTVALLPSAVSEVDRNRRLKDFAPDLIITERTANLPPPTTESSGLEGKVVLWSSGSRGLPKAVIFEAAALMWNAAVNARVLALTGGDRAFVHLNGAYCYAFVHQILSHLTVGASVAFARSPGWLPDLGADLGEASATTIAVVPSVLQACLKMPAVKRSLRRLRQLTVGGASAPEDLLQAAAEGLGGGELIVTYGLTEAGPRVCTRRVTAGVTADPGTVGVPLPGVNISIDSRGELLVDSPSARHGEFVDGVAVPVSGPVRTGDLAAIGPTGVRICGRVERVVSRGGLKLAASVIEAVLCRHPSVRSAFVTPKPHSRLGQVSKAYVTVCDSGVSSSSLGEYCLRQLGREWVPSEFEIVDCLPAENRFQKEVVSFGDQTLCDDDREAGRLW